MGIQKFDNNINKEIDKTRSCEIKKWGLNKLYHHFVSDKSYHCKIKFKYEMYTGFNFIHYLTDGYNCKSY